ncbi:MAG: aminopeptidase P family protein [Dethiobacter sp.]|jgi:Xaa-Pro aminopeptidase|nr:MAG: aminopeptidase P family protein [Dethiobacter sp.]
MLEKNVAAILVSHRSNVFYLSGFTGSSGFLLVTPEEALLYTDFRYLEQAGEQSPAFEVVKVESSTDYSRAAGLLSQRGLPNLAVEEARLTLREYNMLKEAVSGTALLPLYNFFEEIRAVKEEPEVELIARAARIAVEAWQDVLSLLKPGISELEVAYELEYRLRKRGSERLPFEIIVASGERSALPHGIASTRIIREGELVAVDFGAVSGGYCSDMTRTFLLGEPSEKQQEIYNLVHEAQEMAFKMIKAGQECAGVDAVVRQYFQQQGYGAHFGHGLGHGVGLDVHELPTLSPKGQETLQEMMVFSVEPGIYIEKWGGVRIEDLVVLRHGGLQILTGSDRKLLLG